MYYILFLTLLFYKNKFLRNRLYFALIYCKTKNLI